MRNLSKSKILSSRQCHKKLWLEVHHKELAEYSEQSQKNFAVGNAVGEVSQVIYDPENQGTLIDPFRDGFAAAFAQTQALLSGDKPIFEAAFSVDGGLVLADVMVPSDLGQGWHMVEIKSSTSVKDTHLDDVAVQSYVAKQSGCDLQSIALGHINNQWVYQGEGDYNGLISEVDLSDHADSTQADVEQWFEVAHAVAEQAEEPEIQIGPHCSEPYACAFLAYCSKGEPRAEFPIDWLPSIQANALKDYINDNAVIEMADVPDALLNKLQLRVKQSTLTDSLYFDQEGAQTVLAQHGYPHYYLDFESINPVVPRWAGTTTYQHVPFQFSLHCLQEPGAELQHVEFLDISGDDPQRKFALSLLEHCGHSGPIFVWYQSFESGRIKDLAERFPSLADGLLAIAERLVDLLPITKNYFYHPSQRGSWSIKKVLPAMAPKYNYDDLDGVQDGGMAMQAYAEATHPETSSQRKTDIEQQLLKYCELDTMAMVAIHSYLLGDT